MSRCQSDADGVLMEDFEEFGHEKVFSKLVADFKDSECNGISLPSGSLVKVFFCISGNLKLLPDIVADRI